MLKFTTNVFVPYLAGKCSLLHLLKLLLLLLNLSEDTSTMWLALGCYFTHTNIVAITVASSKLLVYTYQYFAVSRW